MNNVPEWQYKCRLHIQVGYNTLVSSFTEDGPIYSVQSHRRVSVPGQFSANSFPGHRSAFITFNPGMSLKRPAMSFKIEPLDLRRKAKIKKFKDKKSKY